MKIIVLDGETLNPGDLSWEGVAAQGEIEVFARTPQGQIVDRCRDAEIILTNKTPLTAETLSQLPKARLIAVLATGYNVVDVAAARAQGIVVCNVPGYGTGSVAQFTFALILELCHRIGLHGDAVREGVWARQPDFSFWKTSQVELEGKILGLVGFGKIGHAVGTIAQAFGMKVWATKGAHSIALAGDGFAWKTVEAIFQGSDIISLHCPQTTANRAFVNRALLQTMRKSAFLINTARGALIDETDLAAALEEGLLAGAALDVLSQEPPDPHHPLLTARNCLVTPHMAWATQEARSRLMATTVENIGAFLSGTPINVVS